MDYTVGFETLWNMYPKRNGNNPKRKAFNAYNARIRQGAKYHELLKGLGRYVDYCEASHSVGTSFVMHAATFFGPDENFLEEWTPPEPERKTETIEEKGRRLNLNPKVGETMEAYTRRIQQAR